MEQARQILCFEPRGEVQLIYNLCHSSKDKMFLYIKSWPSHTARGDLFTYRIGGVGGKGEE